ncbi:Fc.00g031660.m01.CDS01 [Cosmosporella sp. VM-42]
MALRTACLVLCALTTFCSANLIASKRDDLTACLANAKVPFDVKGGEAWTEDIKPYNLRLAYTPAAVAYPTKTSQIKAAVSCGVKHNVRVTAKGGGHSYASFGYGGENGHLVIILDRLYKVTLSYGKAIVEPGARLGHVAVELYNQGQRAIAHGSCPGVGIAGHVLHGGYGMASRTYGLTLDWLIGATVVLANATQVYCSATENSDLFWALRGAGSSFGIVTEFEFNTFAAPGKVTPFSIELDWDRDEAVRGLEAFQSFGINAPKELNMQIYLAPGGQTVQGAFYGDRNGLNKALKPFLGEVGATISTASTMGWIKSLEHFSGGLALDQKGPNKQHNTFYTTSLMSKALNNGQIESFVKAIFDNAKDPKARHSWYILMDLHGGENSVVRSLPPSATAYVHRDKLWLFQFSDSVSSGTYPQAGFSLLKGLRESITKLAGGIAWGMYTNYIDSQLDSQTAQQWYWGNNLFRGNLNRLQSIKLALDPENVFYNPQGVRPA